MLLQRLRLEKQSPFRLFDASCALQTHREHGIHDSMLHDPKRERSKIEQAGRTFAWPECRGRSVRAVAVACRRLGDRRWDVGCAAEVLPCCPKCKAGKGCFGFRWMPLAALSAWKSTDYRAIRVGDLRSRAEGCGQNTAGRLASAQAVARPNVQMFGGDSAGCGTLALGSLESPRVGNQTILVELNCVS